MTGTTGFVVCLLAVAGLVIVPAPRPARRRLRRLPRLASDRAGMPDLGRGSVPASRLRARPDPTRLGAGLGGVAVAVVVGGWFGLLVGLGAAAALDRWLRRLPAAAVRARSLAEAAELPLAADLLAVALRSGAPVDRAVDAVARALPGPLGARLGRVARMLQLGGAPADAWAELAPVAGAHRLVRVAVRGAEHGSALAGAFRRLADDLRADRTIAVEAAARRSGVLIVLPLGLCFLPAFILAGLVPVIVAVLGDVMSIEKGVI